MPDAMVRDPFSIPFMYQESLLMQEVPLNYGHLDFFKMTLIFEKDSKTIYLTVAWDFEN